MGFSYKFVFAAVTTTNEAIKALKLLRESKDKFDLVISDVHMPDMDGFKLLELVDFEMDLPVISKLSSAQRKLSLVVYQAGQFYVNFGLLYFK